MDNYEGQVASIPLGIGGLLTDAAQSNIPATNLILANNVTLYNKILEKGYGSRQWNQTALPAGIRRFTEFFPQYQGNEQRIIALLEDGTMYMLLNNFSQQLISSSDGGPTNLNPNNYASMVVGGAELAARPKKVFTFTGYDPVQVIAGENTTRTTISKPPPDWTGTNQPFWGVIHRGRLFAGGCPNNPYHVYASSATDQEDFTTLPFNFDVYPGEGDTIVGGSVWRGRFFLFKYPQGAYYLVDDDSDSANWYFTKLTGDFGACSPQSFGTSGDDLLVANNYGSITSVQAAFQLGDVSLADIFFELNVRRFSIDQLRPDQVFQRDMIFYGYKRQFFVSFQSYMQPFPDRILCLDVQSPGQPAKISFSFKDQPTCLGLIRDGVRIARPYYGARDGFLYQMDCEDRWVGPEQGDERVAYEMDAQTPHMDFSQADALAGGQVKLFDFIQLEYEPTGNWNVNVTVYLDSRIMGTYPVNLSGRSNLDQFPLADSVVDGEVGFSDRIPIYGEGKRISLRFRNNGLGQNVRLVKAYVYYRPSAVQQTIG